MRVCYMCFVSACKSICLSGGCQTCVRSFSSSPSVPPFFSFVISCQPDTGRTEFHYNPNVSLYVRGKCKMTFIMCDFLFYLYDCKNFSLYKYVYSLQYVYNPCCCVCIMIFIMKVYFTFFSNSTALASLVSTLVWSTMFSVERTEQRKREREIEKRLVNTIKVSDNGPVHVWLWRHRTLQSGTCCVHTHIHKQTHTHRASVQSFYFFSPLSQYSKVKIRGTIVKTCHYNRMLSVPCRFYTSLSFKPYIHTHLSDCVCMCERCGSTLICHYANTSPTTLFESLTFIFLFLTDCKK